MRAASRYRNAKVLSNPDAFLKYASAVSTLPWSSTYSAFRQSSCTSGFVLRGYKEKKLLLSGLKASCSSTTIFSAICFCNSRRSCVFPEKDLLNNTAPDSASETDSKEDCG